MPLFKYSKIIKINTKSIHQVTLFVTFFYPMLLYVLHFNRCWELMSKIKSPNHKYLDKPMSSWQKLWASKFQNFVQVICNNVKISLWTLQQKSKLILGVARSNWFNTKKYCQMYQKKTTKQKQLQSFFKSKTEVPSSLLRWN